MRRRWIRHLPVVFGACPNSGFPRTCSAPGSARCATTPRSAATYLRAVPQPHRLLAWADQQRTFTGPVLIICARDDKLMPPTHAERLADHFGNTQLAWIDDSYTLIPIDRSEILTDDLHALRATET